MGAPDVSVRRTFRAPRRLVWALLADTNLYDRALGLSMPRYTWREIEGERCMVGEAKQGGMKISWIERPYEWVEGRFLEGRRDFITGPAAEGGVRIEVEDAPDGCAATVVASGSARALALKLVSPLLRGALRRRMEAYLDGIAGVLKDHSSLKSLREDADDEPSVTQVQELMMRGEGLFVGASRTATDVAELDRRRKRLAASADDDEVVAQISEFLIGRPDDEVAQIRPFELARVWGMPRREVLRGFLFATQAGLVDLNWQINCPVCKVSASVVTSLADVGREVHCDSCNIDYAIAFGENVEAVFRCNTALRNVQPSVYCASSPTFRPHVLAQVGVDAGAVRTEALPLWCGHLRARTLEGTPPATYKSDAAPARLQVVVTEERVEITAEGHAEDGAGPDVTIRNETNVAAHVLLERAGWSADAALGSVVASMSEFIDLFATEAPAAGLDLSIGRLTLLFSDLTGSTALYTRIGDARAFAIVQEHFKIVEAIVVRHQGALVKTMGDAVMATFSSLPAAVAAAIEVAKETRDRHGDLDIGIKIGVHEGPCLAVRANDRLDFFGTTVNVAARLQGQARDGELVLHHATIDQPEVAALLKDRPRREFDAGLKGIDGPQRLVAIDLGPGGRC